MSLNLVNLTVKRAVEAEQGKFLGMVGSSFGEISLQVDFVD